MRCVMFISAIAVIIANVNHVHYYQSTVLFMYSLLGTIEGVEHSRQTFNLHFCACEGCILLLQFIR
jgi:hypothetical protein